MSILYRNVRFVLKTKNPIEALKLPTFAELYNNKFLSSQWCWNVDQGEKPNIVITKTHD